jgi:hypothetical protein
MESSAGKVAERVKEGRMEEGVSKAVSYIANC